MTEESLRALLTQEGRELLSLYAESFYEEFVLIKDPRLTKELRQGIAEQLRCKKALKKIPLFQKHGAIVEKDLVEQATPEPVARFKSSLMSGQSCCELTGGLGADSVFLAENFGSYTFCEIEPVRAAMFEHNKSLFSQSEIEVFAGDSIEYLRKTKMYYDWIYADPARRSGGRKGRIALADCLPNILDNEALIRECCSQCALKLSPAYDLVQLKRELPWIDTVYVISYQREVRELLAVGSPSSGDVPLAAKAVGLHADGTVLFSYDSADASSNCTVAEGVGKYLYEPDPAIIKADLASACGASYGLKRLAKNGVFLTGDIFVEDFPGRVFEVVSEVAWQRKEVARYLKSKSVSKASVMRRDFPVAAEELKKRFKLQESQRVALLFTTLSENRRVVFHLNRC